MNRFYRAVLLCVLGLPLLCASPLCCSDTKLLEEKVIKLEQENADLLKQLEEHARAREEHATLRQKDLRTIALLEERIKDLEGKDSSLQDQAEQAEVVEEEKKEPIESKDSESIDHREAILGVEGIEPDQDDDDDEDTSLLNTGG